MFEYNVEELRLINEKPDKITKKFSFEESVSRKDKIAFIDERTDGAMTYILELSKKFNKEKDSLSKDTWGLINTNSLKGWIRRNDERGLVDNSYKIGHINFPICEKMHCNNRVITDIDGWSVYDTFKGFVDEMFHRTLVELRIEEERYFRSKDEYSSLCDKIIYGFNHHTYSDFGINIGYSSSGEVSIYDPDDYKKSRPATIVELREIIDKNEQVEEFVAMLSKETDISYDKPKGEPYKKPKKFELEK